MIKIASIANNYGESYDGVGDFARTQNTNFPNSVEYTVYTSKCTYEVSRIRRVLGLGMCQAIFKAFFECSRLSTNVVMLEYPFVEWNPIILLPTCLLKLKIKRLHGVFVLSLHEYNRVNPLRKCVIQILCRLSDAVFVSNDELSEAVKEYCKTVKVRPIPTNIYDAEIIQKKTKKNDREFVYFGLINATKSFEEMLLAWDIYNEDNTKVLYVLSGTKVDNLENMHKGVRYVYKGSKVDVIELMKTAKACLLPVKPCVDEKNTTFKTGAITGCICIGKFCDKYKNLPFVLNMEEYTIESFLKVFRELDKIEASEITTLQEKAVDFGVRYSPDKISELVAEELSKLVGEKA